MALSKLIVGGFKSLRDPIDIPIAPITLLFGPNSAGKSVVRDAISELRRRLAINVAVSESNEELAASLRRLTTGDNVAHNLAQVDDYGDATTTMILLGCVDDDFVCNGSTTMAAENEWTDSGRKLYFSLNDKKVRYQFVDNSSDQRVAHELHVDDRLFMSYTDRNVAKDHKLWPHVPENDRISRWNFNQMGLLKFHLGHQIADDPLLRTLIDQLIDAGLKIDPTWANRLFWKNDDIFHIRINNIGAMCQNWASYGGYYFGNPDYRNQITSTLIASLDALCFTVNELVRQLEFSLEQDLGKLIMFPA